MSKGAVGVLLVMAICILAGCGGGGALDQPQENGFNPPPGIGDGTIRVSVNFPDAADQDAVLLAKYPNAQVAPPSRVIVGSTRKVHVVVSRGEFTRDQMCTPEQPSVTFELPAGEGYTVRAVQLDAEDAPILKVAEQGGVAVEPNQTAEVKLSFIDRWEPDNGPDTATILEDRVVQREHSFELSTDGTGVDHDWLKFEAHAAHTYHLATGELGGGADTVLTLFDAEEHQLAQNDDAEEGVLRSLIVYTPQHDGVLFLRCTHKDDAHSRGYYNIVRETTAPSVGNLHVTVE